MRQINFFLLTSFTICEEETEVPIKCSERCEMLFIHNNKRLFLKGMVPNISSSPLSWKPVPRDWQHPRQGTIYVRVLCVSAQLPATDRFPWHPTKSSFQVSVPVYRGAAPLFSPLASLLLPALCPSVALGSSSPPLPSHRRSPALSRSELHRRLSPSPPGTGGQSGWRRGSRLHPVLSITPADLGPGCVPVLA